MPTPARLLCALVLSGIPLQAPATPGRPQASGADWHLVVLGIAQDGGIPQLGCDRPLCRDIRAGKTTLGTTRG